jgi:hypothetical protein
MMQSTANDDEEVVVFDRSFAAGSSAPEPQDDRGVLGISAGASSRPGKMRFSAGGASHRGPRQGSACHPDTISGFFFACDELIGYIKKKKSAQVLVISSGELLSLRRIKRSDHVVVEHKFPMTNIRSIVYKEGRSITVILRTEERFIFFAPKSEQIAACLKENLFPTEVGTTAVPLEASATTMAELLVNTPKPLSRSRRVVGPSALSCAAGAVPSPAACG